MRRSTTPDTRFAELAGEQHRVVSAAQLAAVGLGEAAVRRRVGAGWLCRVHRGVYSVGHARLTREGLWMAAVLACGDGARLSFCSAGAHWELRPTAATRVDVTVPRGSGR